mmetsp:Transcript_52338/g.112130  ORF Transcript_52338/g.112130 Transcript_52338/m.112130 type:complete len:251 (-) Transcript_52338:155-907(-)
MAIIIRCFSPPDNVDQFWSILSAPTPHSSMIGPGSNFALPLFTTNFSMLRHMSRGVPGRSAFPWCTYSTSRLHWVTWVMLAGFSRKLMAPSASVKSEMNFRTVVLPMPLGPMMQVTCPGLASKSTFTGLFLAISPEMLSFSTGSPAPLAPLPSETFLSINGTSPVATSLSRVSCFFPDFFHAAGLKNCPIRMRLCGLHRVSLAKRPRASNRDRMVSPLISPTDKKVVPEMRKVMTIWYRAALVGLDPPNT